VTPDEAWRQLLELVEQSTSGGEDRSEPQLRWLRSNRLALLGRWQVQARFVIEPGKYSIYFERYGADIGHQNFELPPGAGSPKQTVWTMQLEVSDSEAFWRFSNGQTLKSPDLAQRLIRRLREFHDEYGMSIIAPGY
jgi:hypothetical protein